MSGKVLVTVLAASVIACGVLGGIGTAVADPQAGQSSPANPWTDPYVGSDGVWHPPLLHRNQSLPWDRPGATIGPLNAAEKPAGE